MTIKHHASVTHSNNPAYDVSATAWTADHDITGGNIVTTAQRAALDAANAPSGTNAVATMADVGGLPDWWVEDKTVGQRGVVITPPDPLHNGPVVIQAPVGSSANDTDMLYLKDEFGQIVFIITANGGVRLGEGDAGQDGIKLTSHGNQLHLGVFGQNNDAVLTIEAPSTGFSISAGDVGTVFRVGVDGKLGFFDKGAAPVAQPAAPTTLPEVIAALKALGLVAS